MDTDCPQCKQPMKAVAAILKLAPQNWFADSSGTIIKSEPVFHLYCPTCQYVIIRSQRGQILYPPTEG